MLKFSRHINKKRKKQNKTKKKKQAMFAVTQELFYKKKCSQNPGKIFENAPRGLIS